MTRELNLRNQTAQELNIEKLKLEAAITPRIEAVFKNMAKDAQSIYTVSGSLDAAQLSSNYSPEFLKEIRDAMRKSISKFGFNLRKTVEEKHFINFETKFYSSFMLNLEMKQSVVIDDDNLDEKVNEVNNEFLAESSVFIANESEDQNQFVEQTNINMIEAAVALAITQFGERVTSLQQEASDLASRLPTTPPSRRASLARQIDRVNEQIRLANSDRLAIVGNNIRINILAKSPARSELIAEQNIGLAEAWARNREAELVDQANIMGVGGQPIRVIKEWVAILDGSTRESHVAADGQTRPISQPYVVEGERLKYPRDSSLGASASNIMRCRCIENFKIPQPQTRSADPSLLLKAVSDIDLKPTTSMVKEAKRGLDWRREFGRGGTSVGVARARDIANRKNLSPSTIGRMVSFFARHEVDKEAEGFNPGEEGYPSNGRIAWALWGGNPGQSWAKKKWEQIKRERED
jgi:hypothetical protein